MLWAAAGLALGLAAWWGSAAAYRTMDQAPSSRLAVIQKAPDFVLTAQTGERVRLSELPDRVLLISFVFTTCSGSCPATTHRLAQVQQAVKERGWDKDGSVRFMSITVDPARDTPEVLHRYMQLYDLDSGSWTFLTGPAEEVRQVLDDWGMWTRPAANGQLDHPSRIYLVDRKRRVREIYNLAFLKTEWVLDDIGLLLGEP
jgi:protein SCO1